MPSSSRACLPRSLRVLARADFLRVQKSDVRAAGPSFLVLASPGAGSQTRLGVVASKKIGCAVARNRAKRLVREVFRRHTAALPPGFDVIIIARPGAPTRSLADVEAELLHSFARIRKTIARLHAARRP